MDVPSLRRRSSVDELLLDLDSKEEMDHELGFVGQSCNFARESHSFVWVWVYSAVSVTIDSSFNMF